MAVGKITGTRELSRKLVALGKQVGPKILRSATLSATLPILRQAQVNAPVNDRDFLRVTHTGRRVAPGFLKRNIKRKTILSRDKSKVIVLIGPTSEAFYGTQFVEIGTSKMAPQPWLRPAVRQRRKEFIARLRAKLKAGIEKVARS